MNTVINIYKNTNKHIDTNSMKILPNVGHPHSRTCSNTEKQCAELEALGDAENGADSSSENDTVHCQACAAHGFAITLVP